MLYVKITVIRTLHNLGVCWKHRLNMQLNLQIFFGLHVHSCTHWLRPRNSPPPRIWAHTRSLLVSQDRRHLFVTAWLEGLHKKYAEKVYIHAYLQVGNKGKVEVI